jgi:biopolymer transport protein ExbD/biopolymer transport protein TolR
MAMDLDTGKGGKKGRGKPEMNVTPLVDVVLVLLIIFMVVMPAMHKLFWLNVPSRPDPEAEPPEDAQQPLVVSVNERGQIRLNQEVVEDRDLRGRLRRALVARGDRKIYFDAADDAPFERAVEVMDLARGAGAAHIAVMTERLR